MVSLEESYKERKRQEMMRTKLEKLDVVMRRQRLALFASELLPCAAFALRQIQNTIRPFCLPPGDYAALVFSIALHQFRVTVDREKEFVEEIFAHTFAPFGYQVK